MGYIEQNLMNGEHVVYRTKKHWAIFILPTFLLIVPPLGILLLILFFIDYKTAEFAITNKRVLIKVGFIRRETLETLLSKVEGIQVDQGIFGRIFNYGTIIVRGTGGTSNPFKTINAPFEFRKKVQEQIEAVQSGASRIPQSQESLSTKQVKYCSQCGAKNELVARFCSSCGQQTGS